MSRAAPAASAEEDQTGCGVSSRRFGPPGSLNHPNLLTIYFADVHEGCPYLVSELLEGETLRKAVDRGPVPVRTAAEYAAGIASGLAATHDRGITHRDLKPENIFLTKDNRIKILDFGLVKLRETESQLLERTRKHQ